MRSSNFLLSFLLVPAVLFGQADTTTHPWPVTPFNETHSITGVFGEFRNTLTSDHFHNGTDIPKPDGSPAYPVLNGIVTAIGSVPSSGDNAYVRVRYTYHGFSKSDAYVHIAPNPLLHVGDSVFAGQTVLGNILPGLGHVHLTNGVVGAEMNAIRPHGGCTPYIDNYPPRILSVRFFVDESSTEFTNREVSGPVDIVAHIAETNAAFPGDVTGSTSNNGTYIAGYKIYSSDTSVVVYEPPSAGIRFRFSSIPDDAYVHRVFAAGSDLSNHIYTLTNGGGADYINSTGFVSNNAWNTATFPTGEYVVMVFAEDTRGLTDTVYTRVRVRPPDNAPPATPVLVAVTSDSATRFTVRWKPNQDADLLGYRLYFSVDGSNWTQKENEARLTPSTTSITYTVLTQGSIFFRLAAVDSAAPANVSAYSDVYGIRLNSSQRRSLVVDGFERTSGVYRMPSHPFAMTHGRSVPTDFGTCSHSAVADGTVLLQNYDAVDWLLGDQGGSDSTFTTAARARITAYLQGGGKLYVNGSSIAWDLDRPAGPSQDDRDFLHQFLKASYYTRGTHSFDVTGTPTAPFQDVVLRYGVSAEGAPYQLDTTDAVLAADGSSILLQYGQPGSAEYAAAGFRGIFPGGSLSGGVVFSPVPFESITTKAARDTLMRRVLGYFDALTGVESPAGVAGVPDVYTLSQNYPNPFNPATSIEYSLPVPSVVRITLYDVLGREVRTLVHATEEAGRHTIRVDGTSLSSGMYFYRMDAHGTDGRNKTSLSRKLVVMK